MLGDIVVKSAGEALVPVLLLLDRCSSICLKIKCGKTDEGINVGNIVDVDATKELVQVAFVNVARVDVTADCVNRFRIKLVVDSLYSRALPVAED